MRMALGATRGDVVALVVQQAPWPVGPGIVAWSRPRRWRDRVLSQPVVRRQAARSGDVRARGDRAGAVALLASPGPGAARRGVDPTRALSNVSARAVRRLSPRRRAKQSQVTRRASAAAIVGAGRTSDHGLSTCTHHHRLRARCRAHPSRDDERVPSRPERPRHAAPSWRCRAGVRRPSTRPAAARRTRRAAGSGTRGAASDRSDTSRRRAGWKSAAAPSARRRRLAGATRWRA